METFLLPLHEVNERFTKSELYIVAWRSQEQHHHLKKKMKDAKTENTQSKERRTRYGPYDQIPDGLPDEFYAQDTVKDKFGKVMASPGEVNLSQVTGDKARKYMASIGMPFPEMFSTGKVTGA